ncbi:hypothetical protein Vadar_021341 [Vaccinium darrowii]|uniref:Uncharacterized protein n=1 Tax=Vaccinium darrowii TaxID=229202 RepID=A0ACB7Z5K6_9ERIC|nr:hypothetical protein Vadar_021341 [Vaccinium darrowii]
MAVAITARPFSSTSSVLLSRITRPRPKWVILNPLASSSPQPISSSSGVSRKLILYSKPGCCLCDGLKEKLHAAFSLSAPDSLHDVDLQIRDITTNPEWERAYQYEIPVLARVRLDGTEQGITIGLSSKVAGEGYRWRPTTNVKIPPSIDRFLLQSTTERARNTVSTAGTVLNSQKEHSKGRRSGFECRRSGFEGRRSQRGRQQSRSKTNTKNPVDFLIE